MSYSICRISKIKSSGVTGIQIHDRREKGVSHTNKDIDFTRSHENIDLVGQEHKFKTAVKSRIDELNLPRALRKDATVMTQCLITSDSAFCEKMGKKQQIDFFQKSYDFIKDRYGKENMISATIHFDEKTPHMHVNFVPVTKDKRLSAKDLFSPKDLRTLQDDFNKYINDKGYDLERGKVDSKRKHLSVEEFKLEKKQEDILKASESLSKGSEQLSKAINELNSVEAKRSTFGGSYKLSAEDYSVLTTLAKKGHSKVLENTKLKAKVGALQEESEKMDYKYNRLTKENTKLARENISLKRENVKLKNAFDRVEKAIQKLGLVDEVNKEIKSMIPTKQKSYGMER